MKQVYIKVMLRLSVKEWIVFIRYPLREVVAPIVKVFWQLQLLRSPWDLPHLNDLRQVSLIFIICLSDRMLDYYLSPLLTMWIIHVIYDKLFDSVLVKTILFLVPLSEELQHFVVRLILRWLFFDHIEISPTLSGAMLAECTVLLLAKVVRV